MLSEKQNYHCLSPYKAFKEICKDLSFSYMRCDPNAIKIMRIKDEDFQKFSEKKIVSEMKEYISSNLDGRVSYDDIDYVCHILDLINIAFSNNIKVGAFDIYQAVIPNNHNAGILGLIKAIEPIKSMDIVKDKIITISIIERITDNPEIKKTFMNSLTYISDDIKG